MAAKESSIKSTSKHVSPSSALGESSPGDEGCQPWTRPELQLDRFSRPCLLKSALLASTCDGDGEVRMWDMPLRELSGCDARNSSANTMSLINGRKLACSCRHIAATATAWWRHRTENCPSSRGSTICMYLFGCFKYGRDCNEK